MSWDDGFGPPKSTGGMYPIHAEFSVFGRLEPLLTPEQLKSRNLKGIPLVLRVKDPQTGRPYEITDDELRDYIQLAVVEAEEETALTLFPTHFEEKLPFSKEDYEQFGYFQVPHRPISSLERLSVKLADNSEIFIFPSQWIETGYLVFGQLQILPLAYQNVIGGTGIVGAPGGSGTAVFFNSLWNRRWVAALFGISYTAGFRDGMLPKMVNDLIGVIVAMRVLSQIAAAYAAATSISLGIDGLSQSVGTPGPGRYQIRMQDLADQRKRLVRRIRKQFGSGIIVGTI